MRVICLAVLLAAGCGSGGRAWLGSAAPLTGQDAAIALAWPMLQPPAGAEPPPVLWRQQAWVGEAGESVYGQFFYDWHVEVLEQPQLWESALVHELCHAARDAESGDADPGHMGACFARGGLVERANAALGAANPSFEGTPPI